jgi:hypothetical protein
MKIEILEWDDNRYRKLSDACEVCLPQTDFNFRVKIGETIVAFNMRLNIEGEGSHYLIAESCPDEEIRRVLEKYEMWGQGSMLPGMRDVMERLESLPW